MGKWGIHQDLRQCCKMQQKQEGENFGDRLQSTLGSCSVVFVGSDGRLNNAVAEKFATVAGYTPLKTSTIVEKASGMTTEALVREQGTDHVVVTEISILEQLGSMIRCSIGTMGDSWGATARCVPAPACLLRRFWLGRTCSTPDLGRLQSAALTAGTAQSSWHAFARSTIPAAV